MTRMRSFFRVNSDIAASSKGSAIFNKRTHELEGVLVYGSKNYYNNGQCLESHVLDDAYGEEVAIKARYVLQFLNTN